jgi:anti-sigma factor RsiW
MECTPTNGRVDGRLQEAGFGTMKHEFELTLQAYLDGELPERKAREVQAKIQSTAGAATLLEELTATRDALRGNEPEYSLPESREFYWGKIERSIGAGEPAARPAQSHSWYAWFFRYWPQLSGASVAALVLTVGLLRFGGLPGPNEDIENLLDDTGSFTFRSEQQRMTLVWIPKSRPTWEEEFDELE